VILRSDARFERAITLMQDLQFELARVRLVLEHTPGEPIDWLLQEKHQREIPPPGKLAVLTAHSDGSREWELRDDGR